MSILLSFFTQHVFRCIHVITWISSSSLLIWAYSVVRILLLFKICSPVLHFRDNFIFSSFSVLSEIPISQMMDSWNDKYLILTAVYIFDFFYRRFLWIYFFAFKLKILYWCCSPWVCKESDTTERLNNSRRTKLCSGPNAWFNMPKLYLMSAVPTKMSLIFLVFII